MNENKQNNLLRIQCNKLNIIGPAPIRTKFIRNRYLYYCKMCQLRNTMSNWQIVWQLTLLHVPLLFSKRPIFLRKLYSNGYFSTIKGIPKPYQNINMLIRRWKMKWCIDTVGTFVWAQWTERSVLFGIYNDSFYVI